MYAFILRTIVSYITAGLKRRADLCRNIDDNVVRSVNERCTSIDNSLIWTGLRIIADRNAAEVNIVFNRNVR